MTSRQIEVFSAGCPLCLEAIELVKDEACPSCEVVVQDMADPEVAERAKALGVASVPAVAIDGQLADCCTGRAVNLDELRAAGLGRPLQ